MVAKELIFKALDWRKLICILPLVALWVVPLSRAVKFLGYANGIYAQEESLNASNDVHYGIALIVVYSLCFVMDFALCVLFAKRNLILLLLLLAAPVWVVIEIIRFKPEEVIILVPSLNPVWPLIWSTVPLTIGLGIAGFLKSKTNSLGNARTN